MDLKTTTLLETEFDIEITNVNISEMLSRPFFRHVCEKTCADMKIKFVIYFSDITDTIIAKIRNTEQSSSIWSWSITKYSFILSDGSIHNGTFVGRRDESIRLLSLDQVRAWPAPRKIQVKIMVGDYRGDGGDFWDKKHILTEVEDFASVCYPSTFHTRSMENLLYSGIFSDVTLVCDDEREISTHKNLLISSSYFKALFGCNFGKKEQKVVKVECGYNTLKMMVSFLYGGRVEEKEVENWPDLYKTASFYQLEILARHCELQMMVRVTREWGSIRELIRFASMFHAFKLKRFLIYLTRRLQERGEFLVSDPTGTVLYMSI